MNDKYSSYTIRDKNPIKRKLQTLRLDHALLSLDSLNRGFRGKILDYGGGDGELSKRIKNRLPNCEMVCYEPSEKWRKQAGDNLKELKGTKIEFSLDHYTEGFFDYIFCLEVFEHLPPEQTRNALSTMKRLAANEAKIIIGVPNEIHMAALFKGIFRMTRRHGEFDASLTNVLKASLGMPPTKRPISILDKNLPYIHPHVGFDHRVFKRNLGEYFSVERTYGSPLPFLPTFFNFEIYYICKSP